MVMNIAEINDQLIRPDPDSPVRDYYSSVINKNGDQTVSRIFIGTPVTGLVRVEWMGGRYGQIIPMNWSHVEMHQQLPGSVPLGYQVAEAQNLIVKAAIEGNFEWLLFIEHDVVLEPNTFIKINEYIRRQDTPIVSGLYFSRSRPSEPLVFRGRGTGVYTDWEMGDLVWCDGVPPGILLIHMGIIREMWKDSEEYVLFGQTVRRVFETPGRQWIDPEDNNIWYSYGGTSDLDFCTRVMEGGYFKKAGWDKYQDMEYPFLVDTNLFCRHINPDGEMFP